MPRMLKDGGIVEDRARIVDAGAAAHSPAASAGPCFLALADWLKAYPAFDGFRVTPGLWVEGGETIESLATYLAELPAIAIRFSRFSDGAGFSAAALLRETHGFEGELRAFGDLIADQAPQLRRCGFNVIALRDGECLETALAQLLEAGLSYQGSVYSPRTPFKFRF